ncbi:hypothetical protein DC522_20900 [Microvirga sp. KLBC 81]|nr:hypothetical protein DC522_20900 [Microvirga sp. KLBC 81]
MDFSVIDLSGLALRQAGFAAGKEGLVRDKVLWAFRPNVIAPVVSFRQLWCLLRTGHFEERIRRI